MIGTLQVQVNLRMPPFPEFFGKASKYSQSGGVSAVKTLVIVVPTDLPSMVVIVGRQRAARHRILQSCEGARRGIGLAGTIEGTESPTSKIRFQQDVFCAWVSLF